MKCAAASGSGRKGESYETSLVVSWPVNSGHRAKWNLSLAANISRRKLSPLRTIPQERGAARQCS